MNKDSGKRKRLVVYNIIVSILIISFSICSVICIKLYNESKKEWEKYREEFINYSYERLSETTP